MTWNPPETDGGKPITGYELAASLSYTESPTLHCLTTKLTCSLNIPEGETYKVWVWAINSVGKSLPSSIGSVNWGIPYTALTPSPPVEVQQVSFKDGNFVASWQPPLHNGNSPIIRYELEAQKWGSGIVTDTCRTQMLTCSVQVAPGYQYGVLVTAINSAGNSLPVVAGYVSWKKMSTTTTSIKNPAVTTINCYKGKLLKKVTAVKPVCPVGYVRK